MRWLVILAALAVGSCSTDIGPTPGELKARWDAENIFPNNYKNDLLAYLRTYLNNPEHVRAAAISTPQLKQVGPGERYVVCLRYNARDNEGRYAGPKEGAAVYVSARFDQFIDQPRVVKELCKDAALAPFPELEKLTR